MFGIRALEPFKSKENIALLRKLIVNAGAKEDEVQKRYRQSVRQAATSLLDSWGVSGGAV